MTKHEVRIGVVALTDSAPFVVAEQLGFFQAQNLAVRLMRQPSWATLRDKLAYGEIDAAHMLVPMAIALQAGLGGSPRKDILAPLVLNHGGNAVTVGEFLRSLIQNLPVGQTLGAALRSQRADREDVPVFGTVFPFSMHTLQLRRWLVLNDIDPLHDVRIEVVPPVRMATALKAGRLDAFCVGEPYNTLAVNRGLGTIVATGHELWPDAPEKVLGCTRTWAQANPQAFNGLIQALLQACQWLEASTENRRQAAAWLSAEDYINLPQPVLEKALLAMAEDNTGPFIQFSGCLAESIARPLFESLASETHGLVNSALPTADELAHSLIPFGFR
jgi:two-component system, oxyanion-binding sensor